MFGVFQPGIFSPKIANAAKAALQAAQGKTLADVIRETIRQALHHAGILLPPAKLNPRI